MMRRVLDLLVAGILLLATAPALAVICALNWLVTRRIFFRQARIGMGMRPFMILKFQTMVDGAASAGTVTVRGDRRITRLGRILRACKLDELPQLINVLNGDMSLAGPRPLPPNEVAAIPPDLARQIYSSRPGLTGIQQLFFVDEEGTLSATSDPVAAYFDVVLPKKVALELAYARRRTWLLDMIIVVLTPITIFFPRLGRAIFVRFMPGWTDRHVGANPTVALTSPARRES